MALALHAEFGTLGDLLSASRRQVASALNGDRAATSAVFRFKSLMTAAFGITRGSLIDVGNPKSVVAHLRMDLACRRMECVKVLFVDLSYQLIRSHIVSEGSVDRAEFPIKAVLVRALDLGASGLVVAHNHPSGSLEVSDADIRITRKLSAAAEPLQIRVLDHIIVARGGYSSFRERGFL